MESLGISLTGNFFTGTPIKTGDVDITVEAKDARGTILTKQITFKVLGQTDFTILAPDEIHLVRGSNDTQNNPYGDFRIVLVADSEGGFFNDTIRNHMYWLDGGDLEKGYNLSEDFGIGAYHFTGMQNNFLNIHQKPTLYFLNYDANGWPVLPNAGTIEFYINAFDGHQTIRKKIKLIIEDPNNDGSGASISAPAIEPLNSRNNSFSFSTGEEAKSWIRYGTSLTNLELETEKSEFKTSHRLVLSELHPETDYYYQVFSVDKSGNVTQSQIRQFRTNDVEVPNYLVQPQGPLPGTRALRNDAVTLLVSDQDINITPLVNDNSPALGSGLGQVIKILTQPAHGRVRINGNGSINYLLDKDYAGASVKGVADDSFTYTICTLNQSGAQTCGTDSARVDIDIIAATTPSISLKPNLYKQWTDQYGREMARVAYEIKDLDASGMAAFVSGGIWVSESGGLVRTGVSATEYGEGNPRTIHDGIYYTEVALGNYAYCINGIPCGPGDYNYRFVPYDPNVVNPIRISLGSTDGTGTAISVVYGSFQGGEQSRVRVQLGNESVPMEGDNSVITRPEFRCFSVVGCDLFQPGSYFPSHIYSGLTSGSDGIGGYLSVVKTGVTAGVATQIQLRVPDTTNIVPGGIISGGTYGLNFDYSVTPMVRQQQLAISAPGQINNTGFGATLPITITGLPTGNSNVTLNIYQSATSNVVLYTVTVPVTGDGVVTFMIPSRSNGVNLYGGDFAYGIVAGTTAQPLIYPAYGLARPQVRINAPTVAAPTASGMGYRVSGQPRLRFTGTIPGYSQSRLNPNGTARYQAYFMITGPTGETTLHAVPVDANNNFIVNVPYPTHPDGYSGYQGVTARLVILPTGANFGSGPFNFTQVQNILNASLSTVGIPMSNLRI